MTDDDREGLSTERSPDEVVSRWSDPFLPPPPKLFSTYIEEDAPRLFRRLSEEKHADDFARGDIWLSTLESCRRHDGLRGDRGEATLSYDSGFVSGADDDRDVRAVTANLGMHVRGTVTIDNCGSYHRIHDGLILCMSLHNNSTDLSKFGGHAVEIQQPRAFFQILTRVLADAVPLWAARLQRVAYAGRDVHGATRLPGPVGFVKPPEFAGEQEVRALWIPWDRRKKVMPVTVRSPALSFLVRRL